MKKNIIVLLISMVLIVCNSEKSKMSNGIGVDDDYITSDEAQEYVMLNKAKFDSDYKSVENQREIYRKYYFKLSSIEVKFSLIKSRLELIRKVAKLKKQEQKILDNIIRDLNIESFSNRSILSYSNKVIEVFGVKRANLFFNTMHNIEEIKLQQTKIKFGQPADPTIGELPDCECAVNGSGDCYDDSDPSRPPIAIPCYTGIESCEEGDLFFGLGFGCGFLWLSHCNGMCFDQ